MRREEDDIMEAEDYFAGEEDDFSEYEDLFEPEFEVDYYILADDSLARVWYDVEADEYAHGELMGEDGRWHRTPAGDVLAEGEQLSRKEADEIARSLGGTI
ncbi:MAG: hypothetical protein WBF17_27465 [Phycisphaerae bacterium]